MFTGGTGVEPMPILIYTHTCKGIYAHGQVVHPLVPPPAQLQMYLSRFQPGHSGLTNE